MLRRSERVEAKVLAPVPEIDKKDRALEVSFRGRYHEPGPLPRTGGFDLEESAPYSRQLLNQTRQLIVSFTARKDREAQRGN
jgi:hypothetical protein